MHHIAIMDPKWGFIPKILSGEKTIESRWYKTRKAPWGKIYKGDTVYFKDSGEKVIAKARVDDVLQYDGLDEELFSEIIKKFGGSIGLMNKAYKPWYESKRYVILIFLSEPEAIEPFDIDKRGFGCSCAWMSIQDIDRIKK